MVLSRTPVLLAGTALLALAGCGNGADAPRSDPGATEPIASASPSAPGPEDAVSAPTATPTPPTLQPPLPTSTPEPGQPVPPAPPAPPPPPLTASDKGEKGARGVLLAWARALENRQFALARAQFGHPPSSEAAFVRWWERYATITVAVPGGEMDAGAGSLTYTAPATVTGTTRDGKPFRLQGDVVLRRVNDVDGATPAQLRWHIDSADLQAVPVR